MSASDEALQWMATVVLLRKFLNLLVKILEADVSPFAAFPRAFLVLLWV